MTTTADVWSTIDQALSQIPGTFLLTFAMNSISQGDNMASLIASALPIIEYALMGIGAYTIIQSIFGGSSGETTTTTYVDPMTSMMSMMMSMMMMNQLSSMLSSVFNKSGGFMTIIEQILPIAIIIIVVLLFTKKIKF